MKVNVRLRIGYPGAEHEDVLEMPDDFTEAQIQAEVEEWSWNYIELDWRVQE